MTDDAQSKRASRPAVDELSDLQWARIERGLWQRLDAEPAAAADDEPAAPRYGSPRRRLRALALGGGLALAAAAALLLWARDERGGHGELVGEAPARVVTRESATTVSFAEAAIEVAPRSALLMSGSAERGATIVLEHGRAGFHVAPRGAERPFVVVAGNVMVRVVGTRFEVARQGEAIDVAVREGKVDVRYLGQVHRVAAGERWSSPVTTETAVLLDGGAASGGAHKDPDGDTNDVANDANGAAAAGGNGSVPSEAASDAAAAPPDAAPARPTPRRRAQDPLAAPSSSQASPRTTEPPEDATPPEAVAPSPPPPSEAALAQFRGAAALESSAPKEALRRYLELSRRDDRLGGNALFAAARLAFDLGDRGRGAELARDYLRRFPSGLNAPDARALLRNAP